MIARLAGPTIVGLIALLATLSASEPAAAQSSNILWKDCFEVFECGTMKVPLRHDAPAGGNIELALVRAPALDQENKIGSLLVNFGGPGGPGVEGVIQSIDSFPPELRERFDVVGFDPRGVGQSSAIDCIDNFDDFVTDATPDTPLEVNNAIEEAKEFGDDCQRRSGSLIQYVNSEAAARDMDLIREELGEEKLTYLGFSYGTFLGATYAEFFPDRVRAVLLDGGIATDLEPEQDITQQAMGFELALDSFFSVCAADPDCPFKAPDLEAEFEDLLARAENAPLGGWSYPIGRNEILNATAGALYNREFAWLVLAEAMRQAAEDGTGAGFGLILDFGGDEDLDDDAFTNPYESFIAISCVDFWGFRSEQHFRQTLTDAKVAAPHFGELFVYGTLPCVFWPPAERRVPRVYAATGAAPILVVGTRYDPATPYVWSEELAAGLESATLLTFDGDGHTAISYGNECIVSYAMAYLIDLTMPPPGTVCANTYGDTFPPAPGAAPAPEPTPAGAPAHDDFAPAPTGSISPPNTGTGGDLASREHGGTPTLAAWAVLAATSIGFALRRSRA